MVHFADQVDFAIQDSVVATCRTRGLGFFGAFQAQRQMDRLCIRLRSPTAEYFRAKVVECLGWRPPLPVTDEWEARSAAVAD